MARRKLRWSLKEAGELLGVSSETVRREIHRRKIGHLIVGGQYFLLRPHLKKYVGEENFKTLMGEK